MTIEELDYCLEQLHNHLSNGILQNNLAILRRDSGEIYCREYIGHLFLAYNNDTHDFAEECIWTWANGDYDGSGDYLRDAREFWAQTDEDRENCDGDDEVSDLMADWICENERESLLWLVEEEIEL